MESRVHAIKLVHDNGVIEDIKSGVVITKDGDSMSFNCVNLLPREQMLITAIALHQLLQEYLPNDDEEESIVIGVLVGFIKALFHTEEIKGDVLQ